MYVTQCYKWDLSGSVLLDDLTRRSRDAED